MPNLFSLRPVVILAWVPASTSGLTRMVMSALTPSWPATAFSVSSSDELSTLIWPTPASSAAISSEAFLPTPE